MLASVAIPANTPQLLYTSPAGGTRTVFSVTLCNRSGNPLVASLYLCAAGAGPDVPNLIEANAAIPPNSSLERTGLVLKAGQALWATANDSTINAVVYGIEE